MRNPELKILLVIVELGYALATWPASAQAPAQAPPAGSQAKERRSSRPRHMPCQILERYQQSPKIGLVYNLHYRDGLLVAAGHQGADCVTLSDCHLLPETPDLRYVYDDLGRVIEATGPVSKETLNVTYDKIKGKPLEYEHVDNSDAGDPSGSRTVLTIDSSGHQAASMERTTRGSLRLTTTARFYGGREMDPVVWPYAPHMLYLGWARRTATTTAIGRRGTAYENETLTFDREGRLLKEVSVVDFQGRTRVEREFLYDCPSERPITR